MASRSITCARCSGSMEEGKEQLPVVTYRCRRCGYLESYA